MLWPITYVRFDTSEMISYIPLGFALADAVTRVILDKEAEIDAGAGAQLRATARYISAPRMWANSLR